MTGQQIYVSITKYLKAEFLLSLTVLGAVSLLYLVFNQPSKVVEQSRC